MSFYLQYVFVCARFIIIDSGGVKKRSHHTTHVVRSAFKGSPYVPVIDERWERLHSSSGLWTFSFLCQQHSTSRRRAPRALLDISPAATWPCVSPSSCTATASTTAGTKLTRRTAVSRRLCCKSCLCTAWQQIRGSRGGETSIGLFEINYILCLCDFFSFSFFLISERCKILMRAAITITQLFGLLNLLSVRLFNCFSLGEVWMLIVMGNSYVTPYFKHDLFARTKT